MPFGLKNIGAIYRYLMDRIFEEIICQSIEVYIDDMVAKSTSDIEHLESLGTISQFE